MPHIDIIVGTNVYHNGNIFIQRFLGSQKQHLNNSSFSTATQTFVSFLFANSNVSVCVWLGEVKMTKECLP